jgi:uncharacterized protein (TIGR02246 family)
VCIYLRVFALTIMSLFLVAGRAQPAQGQEDAVIESVRKGVETAATAFNAGKVDELAAMFLPEGEFIDEEGVIYQGQQEIKGLFSAFFEKFPESKLAVDVESIRLTGPVATEEGTRTITTKDGATRSQFRYIAVLGKSDSGWKIASFREFSDDPVPTPHEYLQPLAGLVGDWVNEGADGKVAISYRWSEDQNFLLGEFQMTSAGNPTTTSSQRIGWDPQAQLIRSWLFDADGGFSNGQWTVVDDGIVIKSSSVNPDGGTASATMTIVAIDKDHFSITGTERIVGDSREPDFEITVTRRLPTAGK